MDPLAIIIHAAAALLAGLFAITAWLLRNKDAAQEAQIDLLFRKHDDDAARLDALRLEIARNHYERNELDQRFDRLDHTIKDGLERIGAKVDRLSDAMLAHISKEGNP